MRKKWVRVGNEGSKEKIKVEGEREQVKEEDHSRVHEEEEEEEEEENEAEEEEKEEEEDDTEWAGLEQEGEMMMIQQQACYNPNNIAIQGELLGLLNDMLSLPAQLCRVPWLLTSEDFVESYVRFLYFNLLKLYNQPLSLRSSSSLPSSSSSSTASSSLLKPPPVSLPFPPHPLLLLLLHPLPGLVLS